ncbi:MAG: restriction endonuclease subunit S [Clostridia bacterium]
MGNWREVTLKDICTKIGDGLHGTPNYDLSGEYYFINGNNLVNGKILFKEDTKRISHDGYQNHKKDLNDRTLLVSINGTIGNVAEYNNEKCILGKSACYLNVCDEVDKIYVKYILYNNNFQYYIAKTYTGTTIKNVSLKDIRNYTFNLPPLQEQKAIAETLSCLDDKIELNQKMNKNLEEQAQAIFKSWFVDFEPFGGTMPSDWIETNLEDIACLYNGYSYKGNELQSSNMAMATIKNFSRQGGFKQDGYKEIIPSDKIKDFHYANIFDILVAHTDLTQNADIIGNAEMIMTTLNYSKIVLSMDLVKVAPKNNFNHFLLASILKNNEFKKHALGYVNGTTVLHLSKKALKEYTVYLPKDISTLNILCETLESFYRKISNNIIETETLKQIRDTLLPKLMSGEVRVPFGEG